MRPLYLDCDTGIDDALAIAFLLGSPTVELVAVGTVCGNTSAAQAADNSARLLAVSGRGEIPVAIGEMRPLAADFAGGWPHVHGQNGIGGVVLPEAAQQISTESAPDMLVRLAREHRGRLEILAIGPLTNVARALELDPALPNRVRRLTIMGGAVWSAGNVTAAAEANIHVDPEAAAVVLSAPWKTTVVPLDVTMQHWFTVQHQQRLRSSTSAAAQALASMLDCYLDFHENAYGQRRVALHDPLAAALAVGVATGVVSKNTGIHVELESSARGKTTPLRAGKLVRVVTAVSPSTDQLVLRHLLRGVTVGEKLKG